MTRPILQILQQLLKVLRQLLIENAHIYLQALVELLNQADFSIEYSGRILSCMK